MVVSPVICLATPGIAELLKKMVKNRQLFHRVISLATRGLLLWLWWRRRRTIIALALVFPPNGGGGDGSADENLSNCN